LVYPNGRQIQVIESDQIESNSNFLKVDFILYENDGKYSFQMRNALRKLENRRDNRSGKIQEISNVFKATGTATIYIQKQGGCIEEE
jgi:hypothetical protein